MLLLKSVPRRVKLQMLKTIEEHFPVESWAGTVPAFEALVATILSQNTNDLNRDRAMENLQKRFRTSPKVLAAAPVRHIVECIRPAGLYNEKAPRIKEVARVLLEKYEGKVEKILEMPRDEARRELLELPGVGYKTADILLSFVAGHPTIPVDTHITRVSKRLGVVREKADYEEIRQALEELVPPRSRMGMHLSLIRLGREICKARKPLCPQCPVNMRCPSSTVRR